MVAWAPNQRKKEVLVMAHQPDWVWEPCEICEDPKCEFGFWSDDNQPDSDQTNGATVSEWVGMLIEDGIYPPVGPPRDVVQPYMRGNKR